MKTRLIATTFLALFSFYQAHAAFIPGWERPIKRAEMNVTAKKFGFSNVNKVTITLTHKDAAPGQNPTGMTVEMQNQQTGKTVIEHLVINRMRVDNCGSTEYDASLPQQNRESSEDFGNYARFNVHMVDHTQRICGGLPDGHTGTQWEALIRQGYGFCGTMDSSLSANGNPEDVVTIQNEGSPQ